MHLVRIDVLRALAIGLVFMHHAQICLFPGYFIDTFNNGWLELRSFRDVLLNLGPGGFGWSGVQIFLLISGFLIHLGYLRDLEKGRNFSPRTFFSKRFWRIYPPYVITLLFFCFAVNGGRYLIDPVHRAELLTHLALVHNLSASTVTKINPSYWSIALEAQLYLIYPILLWGRKQWGMDRTFGIIVIVGAIILIANRLGYPGNWSLAYMANVVAYWYVWAAGAFLAERYKMGKSVFPFRMNTLLLGSLAICAMLFCHIFQPMRTFTVPLLVLGTTALFEWWLKLDLDPKLESSLPYKALVAIGLCSYSIYLIHQPYLRDLLRSFGKYSNEPLALIMKTGVVFGLLFLISYAFYLLVEQPSIAWGAKLREARKRGGPAG